MVLVAANLLLFGLEVLWGGSTNPGTLVAMGANLGWSALAAEPWRLLSCAFLHIGLLHLAMNMAVLYGLGQRLEPALGPARFIVLYTLSAAAGSVVSALRHDLMLSAGASGAVWGLMVAETVALLQIRRRLPPGETIDLRVLMQPLVINLGVSFLPGVDLWAHLGGGLAGGALLGSGLVSPWRPAGPLWRVGGWAAAALLAASVAAALQAGRPWAPP